MCRKKEGWGALLAAVGHQEDLYAKVGKEMEEQ